MQVISLFLVLMISTLVGTSAVYPQEWLKLSDKAFPEHIILSVKNPSDLTRPNEPIIIRTAELYEITSRFNPKSFVITDEAGQVIPSQADDLDGDDKPDEVVFTLGFKPRQERTAYIYIDPTGKALGFQYPKRVHAQMAIKVAKETYEPRTVMSSETGNLWKESEHHGPAWESEWIGYRVYFDDKSAIDFYGKHEPRLELERTRWYTSKLLQTEGFGRDVFLVGETLGVGSVRGWDGTGALKITPVRRRTARIIADGPVRAIVEMKAEGWKLGSRQADITSRFTIYSGQRHTIHEVILGNVPEDLALCTGIIKVNEARVVKDDGWIALWGDQIPSPKAQKKETVGLGVIIPKTYFDGFTQDKSNHIALLKFKGKKRLTFLFTAAWAGERQGVNSADKFINHVRALAQRTKYPIILGEMYLHSKQSLKKDFSKPKNGTTAQESIKKKD